MNTELIRGCLQARPFVPFEVHMTNGEVHPIAHPENAWLVATRLFVYHPESDQVAILSLLHVASLAHAMPA